MAFQQTAPSFLTRISLRALIALCLVSAGALPAFAQEPVNVTVQLLPPHSTKISDYYLGTTPKLTVTLINHDLTKPALHARLRMSIKTATGAVMAQSSETAIYPGLYLDAGVPLQVTLQDLAPYFNAANLTFSGISKQDYQTKGRLPEGTYQFCFEAVEYATKQSLSKVSCATSMLSLDEPPLLNQPAKDAKITPREPTNIIFSWTPRHMGSLAAAFNIEYLFQLIEINDKSVNPQSAFESGRPLYERVTDATAMLYGPAEPLLLPGRRYAWRAQVRQKINSGDGQQFRNGGFSEVYYFDYVAPSAQQAEFTGPVYQSHCCRQDKEIVNADGLRKYHFNFTWKPAPNAKKHLVEMKYNGYYQAWVVQGSTQQYPGDATSGNGDAFSKYQSEIDNTYQWTFRIGAEMQNGEVKWDSWRNLGNGAAIAGAGLSGAPKIKGLLAWGFSKSDDSSSDSAISLLKGAVKSEELWEKADYQPGKSLFPIPNDLTVHLDEVTGADGKGRSLIIAGKTKDGRFSFDVPDKYKSGTYTLAIHEEGSPLFNGRQAELVFKYNFKDTTLPTIVLTPKTTRLSVGVVCPECYDTSKLAVDILANEYDLKKMPHMGLAGIGVEPETIVYGGNNYKVIATLKTGNLYRRLINPSEQGMHYWMRVRYNNAPPRFYPLPATYTDKPDRQLLTRWVDYPLKDIRQIAGIVRFNGNPRWGTRVRMTIPATSILPAGSKEIVVEATTDGHGDYVLKGIPEIIKGAPFTIAAIDGGIRPAPYEYALTGDGATQRTFDMNLQNPMLMVVGRIIDEAGAPVSNAVVTLGNEQARTSTQGFYVLKIWDAAPKTIKVTANEFQDQTIAFQPRKFDQEGGRSSYGWEDLRRAIEKTSAMSEYRKAAGNPTVEPWTVGFSGVNFERAFAENVKSGETLRGVGDAGKATMKKMRGYLRLNMLAAGTKAPGRLRLSNGLEYSMQSGVAQEMPFGQYTWTLSSLPGETAFLAVTGQAVLRPGDTTTLDVTLTPGTLLSGKVKELRSGDFQEGVNIATVELPYSCKTGKDGSYSMVVPRNTEIALQFTKDNLDIVDTVVRLATATAAINVSMYLRDPNVPRIKTISGFPVSIAHIVATPHKGSYQVSGIMSLPANKVFSIKTGDTSRGRVTFKNTIVKVGDDGETAEAEADIRFEEAVLNVVAWGWAPVEVRGSPFIKLRAVSKDDYKYTRSKTDDRLTYERGTIGGKSLILKLSNVDKVAGLPVTLADAELTLFNTALVTRDSIRGQFRDVFLPTDLNTVAVSENAEYKMRFLYADTGRVLNKNGLSKDAGEKTDPRYYRSKFGIITDVLLARDSAMLNKFGMNLAGYVQWPEIPGTKGKDSGRIRLDKLIIDKDFIVKEVSFRVGEKNPYVVGVQKLSARLTNIIVKDLGTPNMSFGVGGMIMLKGDSTGGAKAPGGAASAAATKKTATGKGNDTLFIKELSVTRRPEGNTIIAELKLGEKGIGIKGLTFTTPGLSTIRMAYNNADKSFDFKGSGMINYVKANAGDAGKNQKPGQDSATSSMFPIEIQTFQLKSKDWSLFLAAKANIQVDMKVMKINVERIVVNVGANMSMQKMNSYLLAEDEAGQKGITEQDADPDEALDEAAASWGIGIRGGVGFSIAGLSTGVKGSFLVANVENKIQVVVNELGLSIVTSPFKLEAKVRMEFNDERQGFEAEATMTIMKKGLEATLKYYQVYPKDGKKGGIVYGASLVASVAVPTGPITWHKIGGGFDFNTVESKYNVWLEGSLGPSGTPPEVVKIDDAKINVLFQTETCGMWPVIEGGAKLFTMEQQVGSVALKADLCNKLLLLTIQTDKPLPVPMVPGLMAKYNGVFFARTSEVAGKQKGTIFLYAGADLSTLGNILEGNLNLAIALNYDNADTKTPKECKAMWDNITPTAKDGSTMHAVAVTGTVTVPRIDQGFDLKVGGVSLASANFYFNAGGKCMMSYKIGNGSTAASIDAAIACGAKVTLLKWEMSATADARVMLAGGYANLQEEAIRAKYDALKNKAIDYYVTPPQYMLPTNANASTTLSTAITNGKNVSMRAKPADETWETDFENAYNPQFVREASAYVGQSWLETFTGAQYGGKFDFTLNTTPDLSGRVIFRCISNRKGRKMKVTVNATYLGEVEQKSTTNGDEYLELRIPQNVFEQNGTTTTVRCESSSKDGIGVVSCQIIGTDGSTSRSADKAVRYNNAFEALYEGKWYDLAKASGGSFEYEMPSKGLYWKKDDTKYKLRVRYRGDEFNRSVIIRINDRYGPPLAVQKINRNASGFMDVDYPLTPNMVSAFRMGVYFEAPKNGFTPSVFRTSLLMDGKVIDDYTPHPKEVQEKYVADLDNALKGVKFLNTGSDTRNKTIRGDYSDANWDYDYRRKFETSRTATSTSNSIIISANNGEVYTMTGANGWFSNQFDVGQERELRLRLRFWGGEKNKAMKIYINGNELGRATVNESEYPNSFYDVDYIIPKEFVTGNILTVKYVTEESETSPAVFKSSILHDYAYWEKKMLQELDAVKGTGPRSWYMKGYGEFNVKIAFGSSASCNDYCVFCSSPGFKLCLGAAGKFNWRKPDGGRADLQKEFRFSGRNN